MKFFNLFSQVVTEDQLDIPKTPFTDQSVITGMKIFFSVAAATAVLFIGISAFRMVISRGNADEVKKARDSIIYASIGLAVAMSAFAIVAFVLERI